MTVILETIIGKFAGEPRLHGGLARNTTTVFRDLPITAEIGCRVDKGLEWMQTIQAESPERGVSERVIASAFLVASSSMLPTCLLPCNLRRSLSICGERVALRLKVDRVRG